MARKSKWVEVPTPQEPVVKIARRVLADRLRPVWRYLQRASHGAPADTENVHQLRVSTRRAVATMEIFDELLPSRRKRWINRQLNRVRKAAGTARDLDVMLERFLKLSEAETDEGHAGAFVHFLKVQRQRAQEPIDRYFKKLDRKGFRRRLSGLVRRVRLRTRDEPFKEPTYAAAAQSALEPRVRRFFLASETDLGDYTLLHAFRIEAKHLRYAMEVFAGAFDSSIRTELYPLVADLQERLGTINDHATAQQRFNHWLEEAHQEDELRPALESLLAEERSALKAAHGEFLDWWKPDRRDDLRKRFTSALDMDLSELTADGKCQPTESSSPQSCSSEQSDVLSTSSRGALAERGSKPPPGIQAAPHHDPIGDGTTSRNRPPLSYQPSVVNRHQVMSSRKPT